MVDTPGFVVEEEGDVVDAGDELEDFSAPGETGGEPLHPAIEDITIAAAARAEADVKCTSGDHIAPAVNAQLIRRNGGGECRGGTTLAGLSAPPAMLESHLEI